MITVDDIKSFLNTAGADFSENEIQSAIVLAEKRIKDMLQVETVDDTDSKIKKAWILLSVGELASSVNLYWRGNEKTELIRVKELTAEAEALLGVVPKGAVKWQTLETLIE
ncbi:hypothetical protein [Thermodesulfovibrio thiophilus]|uniref:hypothetical protein n=1 Tax=Thermodesulfovibrio thiophilus TaxID=340095 RepID=UPI000425102B|nr:hypothetical protein [Thermodesulfovibrio thiophilus]